MKTFQALLNECLQHVGEIFPWDLQEIITTRSPLLLDVREPYEFDRLHIQNSINVPRGILETACEYGFEDTVPELVQARNREVIVICRSGNRSVFAAHTMQLMGYQSVVSLKTGVRGWNDYELPLYNSENQPVEMDAADALLNKSPRPDQLAPSS
ncbi:MAG: rhodanese-like domain-containing protein [Thiotrichaceae bacterium]